MGGELDMLADHERRLRDLEGRKDPMGADLVTRFSRAEVTASAAKTAADGQAIILQGAVDDIKEIKADMKAARATIRSALITAAASIAVQVILFFVLSRGGV